MSCCILICISSDTLRIQSRNFPLFPKSIEIVWHILGQYFVICQALAEMGDVLNKKYHSDFVEMTRKLGLTSSTAYKAFAKVASRLFQNGINWGRIVALLLFGYEIAVSVIQKEAMGIRNFLRKIVNFVVTFIIKEKIARWITDQGGWVSFLNVYNAHAKSEISMTLE